MNDKQNVIFFLAVSLLITTFILTGQAKILWHGIFNTGSTSGGTINAPPTQVRLGKNGKCPPGYSRQIAPGGVGAICVLNSKLPL